MATYHPPTHDPTLQLSLADDDDLELEALNCGGKRKASACRAHKARQRIDRVKFPELKQPKIGDVVADAVPLIQAALRTFKASQEALIEYESTAVFDNHAKGLTISTMTIEAKLCGPPNEHDELVAGMASDDVREFNRITFADDPYIQPVINCDSGFKHAVIWKPWPDNKQPRKEQQKRAIHFFYPKPKLHITGCTTMTDVFGALEYARGMLSTATKREYKIESFKVSLVNTDFNVGFRINPCKLVALLQKTVMPSGSKKFVPTYAPLHHLAVHFNCFTKAYRKWHVQVFAKGSVLVSNTRDNSMKSVAFTERVEIYKYVRELLIDNRETICESL
jgi:hypothetical protein